MPALLIVVMGVLAIFNPFGMYVSEVRLLSIFMFGFVVLDSLRYAIIVYDETFWAKTSPFVSKIDPLFAYKISVLVVLLLANCCISIPSTFFDNDK